MPGYLTTPSASASGITNVPSGNISASTLQGAINELDTEKSPIDSPSFTGNVGIGTSSPSAALHVKSAWVTNEGQIQADVPTGGTYSGVTFQNDGALKGLAVWDNANSRMFLSVPGTTGSVVLGYNSVSPALTMDAATRNVGIGTSSPNSMLDINGNLVVRGAGIEGGDISLKNTDRSTNGLVVDVSTDNVGRVFTTQNNSELKLGQLAGTGGNVSIYTSVTERMRIDSNGHITMPYQPMFSVCSPSSGTSQNFLLFQYIETNVGSHYNSTNGRFTAPINGKYLVTWSAIGNNLDDVYRYYLYKNGVKYSNYQVRVDTLASGSNYGAGEKTIIVSLSQNDYIQVYYISDSNNASYINQNYVSFSGYLLG